jgi:zinc protease
VDAVANRKIYLVGSFQRQLQTASGFNATLAGALLRGIEPVEMLKYADRIRAAQGPAATAALGRILKPDQISLVIVGDSAKFIDKVRQLRSDTVVVPVDKLDLATANMLAAGN